MRPGVLNAPRMPFPLMASGVSSDRWFGPASSRRTRLAEFSDMRAANVAPADPAPTTTRSQSAKAFSKSFCLRAWPHDTERTAYREKHVRELADRLAPRPASHPSAG